MRVLVVDDSTIFRKVVRDALSEQPGVEVVGVASDGRKALEKIDKMDDAQLKQYLKRLVRENMTLGIEIITSGDE